MDTQTSPASGMKLATFALVGALVVALVAAVSLPYGNDVDTYFMLGSWQAARKTAVYIPSRYQGTVLLEILFGFAAHWGGAAASNLLAWLGGALSVLCIHRLVGYLGALAGLAFLLVPEVWIGSTSTMEYLPALACFLMGYTAWREGGSVIGAVLMGFAVAVRLQYGLLLWVVVWAAAPRGEWAEKAQVWLAASLVGALGYVPVWESSYLTTEFLGVAPIAGSWTGYVARFLYDTVMLVGLPGGVGLLVGLALDRGRLTGMKAALKEPEFRFGLLMFAVSVVVFMGVPIERGYLIPAVAGLVIMVGRLKMSRLLASLAVGSLVYGMVSVEPLTIERGPDADCRGGSATGARVEPRLTLGPVLEDARGRVDAERCFASDLHPAPEEVGGRLPDPLDVWDSKPAKRFQMDRVDLDDLSERIVPAGQ